jgi:phosphoribosylformylglycinamidine synthase
MYRVSVGLPALSAFRLEKLRARVFLVSGNVVVADTRHYYFIRLRDNAVEDSLKRPIEGVGSSFSKAQAKVLERLLGVQDRAEEPQLTPLVKRVLVVPRLGTISPWSSKATDIAHHCGLDSIERIERGIVYYLYSNSSTKLSKSELLAVYPLIHDKMTESVLENIDMAPEQLFERGQPKPLVTIDIMKRGTDALEQANHEMGLALSRDEIEYLVENFRQLQRNPTDVELMMFAQANSEHCRHKIFNAEWVIDGEAQNISLFGMIRNTHRASPGGTLVAYSDNSSVIEGGVVERFYPRAGRVYTFTNELTHTLMKVETHNHPTAIAPFAGAATGSGGEIRDEGATGCGAKPKAGLTGFSVSNLNIPEFVQPWEKPYGTPSRIASALQVMLEGPIGAASFNNEFGRPNLAGYFRTFEENVSGEMRGYHKPIMVAGGVGNIAAIHTYKRELPAGALVVHLGGPGMLIGLGGGAASSMDTGSNAEQLDFDSVQRSNPEMQRRAQEVIDRCWQLGEENPILSIHDVGAGGMSNALPELVHGGSRGAEFELRKIPLDETGMSPKDIWCNESQERYVLAIARERLEEFRMICERERCPFSVVGVAISADRLTVHDMEFGNYPVDMPLSVLLGKPPKMTRNIKREVPKLTAYDTGQISLADAVERILRLPSVANKSFLISIGDRTVGGMTARDQMVGPWQVPVSDVAVTLMGFTTNRGEAFAMGERTPLALVNAAASGRMAVGEAITNIAAAPIQKIGDIKLSANWMAAAGHHGEDAALFDTVRAVAMELCPQLGIGIPVGKDSMSMKTVWRDREESKSVTAPLSLIVSAFAPTPDVRETLTPQIAPFIDTTLLLIDLGQGKNRMGGSALAQVYNQVGDVAPDVDDALVLKSFFELIQRLNGEGKLFSYHDRSDGGVFVTLCEMAFAGHIGVTINLDESHEDTLRALFNEELGAVIQVRNRDVQHVINLAHDASLKGVQRIATPNQTGVISIMRDGKELFREAGVNLLRIWSETTYQMQMLRDNPECAQQEFDALLDASDPGLHANLTYDLNSMISPLFLRDRPRIAILREQGVNGHVEMAAAFDRAGFAAVDVHMSDIVSGRVSLRDYKGIAACGGFSYGDVLGAGEGWAKSILYNPLARSEFEAFFQRTDTFALGVCNGCQMMSNLREIIPGTEHWAHFSRNRSEQFEARFVMVEIKDSPSIFFKGMAGSRMPIVVSHGEGYADFGSAKRLNAARDLVCLRYVDNYGKPTEAYPLNPNGSPQGITGLTSRNGRFTIMMPHPERVFRAVQNSWYPKGWNENGPWLTMFQNARGWVG